MNKELALLDQIEEIRQRVAEHPENFPVDYVIRLCCSIVANAYGYKSRNAWTDDLKKHPESRYATRLKEDRFHI